MGADADARQCVNNLTAGFLDAMRYLGNFSYAVLPRDVAHSLADLKKSFLGCVKSAVDKEVEWIDERVAGGDRLRDEWRQAYARAQKPDDGSEPIN